jgi:hypothetical protein
MILPCQEFFIKKFNKKVCNKVEAWVQFPAVALRVFTPHNKTKILRDLQTCLQYIQKLGFFLNKKTLLF